MDRLPHPWHLTQCQWNHLHKFRILILGDWRVVDRINRNRNHCRHGVNRTVVGDKAKRFVQQGMLGLQDQRIGKAGRKEHEYPDRIAEQASLTMISSLTPFGPQPLPFLKMDSSRPARTWPSYLRKRSVSSVVSSSSGPQDSGIRLNNPPTNR